jgi:transposase
VTFSQHVAARVNRWEHGRMSGYSEDLRQRIVASVEGGMSKAQVTRTFSVSLSSVKRYADKASRGESLAPKKSPGSTPKLDDRAMKLLEEDLKEHPFATLRDRCDYMEVLTGLSVSRSTMCRAIARIGPTRKKGDD